MRKILTVLGIIASLGVGITLILGSAPQRFISTGVDVYPATEAGLKAAISSFGPAPACGTITMPQGTINISNGSQLFYNRSGCHVTGQGSGDFPAYCSTLLHFTGASGGTVFGVYSVDWSSFEHFCIDGVNTAGIGLFTDASNAVRPTQQITYSDISIFNVAGRAISTGDPASNQTSQIKFYQVDCQGAETCAYQTGNQTLQIKYENFAFIGYTQTGFEQNEGSAVLDLSDFENSINNTVDVQVDPTAGFFNDYTPYHELVGPAPDTEKAYYFPAGNRYVPSVIEGGEVLDVDTTGGNPVVYSQQGVLTIRGTVFTANAPNQGGTVLANTPTGASPCLLDLEAAVFFDANNYSVSNACSLSGTATDVGGGMNRIQ